MTRRPATTAPTVLVVEDEALVALLLENVLAEAGYRPIRTADGRSAPPGLVAAVVDLRLGGGLDGRDVVRRLRARRPALPVVVVTGFRPGAPEADLRGLGGPTLRLRKPFDCDELAASLAAMVAARTAPAATPRRRGRSGRVAPAA